MMRAERVTARLPRQMMAFGGVGLVAALVHYGVLIGLVEAGVFGPVPATLLGYVAGGLVSYALNRRLTYASDRPHAEAGWRFALVAGIGFALTGGFMHVFTARLGAPYLPAQIVTTGIVLVWSFLAHKLWTFPATSPSAGEVERTAGAPGEGGDETAPDRSALLPSPGRRSRGDSTLGSEPESIHSPIKGEGG